MRKKYVIRGLILVLVLLVAYPSWVAWRVYDQSNTDEVRSADAIVVLGAAQYDGRPSPVFEARLKQAAYLYDEGLSPRVIVTGGKAEGDRFSEAEAGERYLVETGGVAADDILRETEGTTTLESLRAVRALTEPLGIDSVLLVSDPMHSERIKMMARDLGFDEAYASWTSYENLDHSRSTKLQELAREVGGIIVYQLFNR